jgi:hypothetical protein
MKAFQYNKLNGEVINVFEGNFAIEDQLETDEIGCIDATGTTDEPEAYYVDGQTIVYRGPRPTKDHFWNGVQWELDDTARLDRLRFEIRKERDERLAACDWVVAKYTERAMTVPEAWVDYRQALRDIPNQIGFPLAVQWPDEPA